MNKNDIKIKNGTLYNANTFDQLKDKDILTDGQIYLYVIQNEPQHYIKIGKTTNIFQRYSSLSGSNGGGNEIVDLYLSPIVYVESMETSLHEYYSKFRIKGTEWFRNLEFKEVIEYVDGLFSTRQFQLCNDLRKKYNLDKRKSND